MAASNFKPLPLRKVAFLADYVPRQCGIATFTADLRDAVSAQYPDVQCPVIAVTDRAEGYPYPSAVRFDFPEGDLQAYRRAADFLNFSNTDVLCVQHEYGIFGGTCGSHVLALLRAVRMPVVTTLHTILKEPSVDQRRVFNELMKLSSRVVVMAQKGVVFLREVYKVRAEKIALIPHGIPDVPFIDPNYYKDHFGVEGKNVLLTFGLLSPNKGIESMLNALPLITKEFPETVYIVLGATHPHLVREQGETYRISLERLAKKNGVEANVIFFNRFVDLEELTEFIGGADIYITPYLNPAQITSGTLAYCYGAGKAVVSTPYWHAEELLGDGRGALVPFNDSEALAAAVVDLLRNETKRHALRKQAYIQGRDMIWSKVAQHYHDAFERARQDHMRSPSVPARPVTLDRQPANLPTLRFDHLVRSSDSVGVLQHSIYTVPDHRHGYCIDDNARALMLMTLLEEQEEEVPFAVPLTSRYAAFVNYAFNPGNGRFRNFMSFDRHWLEDAGSEDSHGRGLWALGVVAGRSRQESLRAWATGLFARAAEKVSGFTSVRAWAFAIMGIHEYLGFLHGDRLALDLCAELAKRIRRLFRKVAKPDWMWCEDIVTYDNAKVPHALLVAARWTGRSELKALALDSLRWLAEAQIAPEGHFRPIGSNGFWRRGEAPAFFDQQPIEAQAMISACLEAYRVTDDRSWITHARRTFEWFLGSNDLNLALYDPQTGGCRDGLHIDRVNQNQGAESTIAFLLSLLEMKQVQADLTAFESSPSAK
ncbi:MAG: glycosyltransferase [Verrucomicrobiales bacterium]